MPHSYIGIIDLEHDVGDEVLKWLEKNEDINNEYYIRFHSMNIVGRINMKNIIKYHDN